MPEITRPGGCLIGEASRRSGVNIETIRYYERIGLMPRPERTSGGNRHYSAQMLRRLAFIRHGRELGFGLDEIRALLGMVDAERVSCNEVRDMTERHLAAVRGRIDRLRRMERVLAGMAAECAKGDVPDCPIIDALFEEA